MKKFDENYVYLEEMYNDEYYANFLIDKIKEEIENFVIELEEDDYSVDEIQDKLDVIMMSINEISEDFKDNNIELEEVGTESISDTIEYILNYYGIDIDIETGLRELNI